MATPGKGGAPGKIALKLHFLEWGSLHLTGKQASSPVIRSLV